MSMMTLALIGELVLVSLAFLAGTTYTSSTLEQESRRQAEEWQRINTARSSVRRQHRGSVATRATIMFAEPDLYED